MKSGKKLKQNKPLKSTFQYALWLLSLRAYSRSNLTEKLFNKNYPPLEIEEVIERLVALRLIDDLALAKNWLSIQNVQRPRGEHLLRQELFRRGVEKEIVDQAFVEIEQDESQEIKNDWDRGKRLIEQLLNKPSIRALELPVKKRKILALLARRGFNYDTAKKLLDEIGYNNNI